MHTKLGHGWREEVAALLDILSKPQVLAMGPSACMYMCTDNSILLPLGATQDLLSMDGATHLSLPISAGCP